MQNRRKRAVAEVLPKNMRYSKNTCLNRLKLRFSLLVTVREKEKFHFLSKMRKNLKN